MLIGQWRKAIHYGPTGTGPAMQYLNFPGPEGIGPGFTDDFFSARKTPHGRACNHGKA